MAATFVLVHGGGHGGWCYQPVAALLRSAGHEVHAPSLTGLGERAHLFRHDVDLDCHITDIVNLLHFENLSNVILVGHSYGGMVITGAADRAPDRVGHLVYLDAANPVNGQALVDIAPEMAAAARANGRIVDGVEMCLYPTDEILPYYGVRDPDQLEWMKARLTPHPWRCFEQPLRLTDEAAIARIPQSHLCTTKYMRWRDVDGLRRKADGRLWDLKTGHDMMITAPGWVAEKLMLVAAGV
ncbi:esterase [Mycobacterium florentinum]|uniref:Esterase n=1 Tax=Mycobacterium florentinum TaxID=292462 RepID=A0A1X1UF10_MYCFL|nr:alpha/beta hydrolase [Mycobacterium florentinum]MCV7411645.1 alpha/beta hydrolase [Mycobacterium florentinum]ORV55318.1 esterase [Mycobacterium florentinum]BBX81008.1 esterase [Mycobacterium florentinum]